MNNKPVAPSNEAVIKSGNKLSFVVPFCNIIHLFGTYFLKENSLAVILNAITTSLMRLLKNRFDSLGDFKYMLLLLGSLYCSFSSHLVPAFKSHDLPSVHVMVSVAKCCCICNSLEGTTNNHKLDELGE